MSVTKDKRNLYINNDSSMDSLHFATKIPSSDQSLNWAELAQQWIQMKDRSESEIVERRHEVCSERLAGEKGEADMEMDDEEQNDGVTQGHQTIIHNGVPPQPIAQPPFPPPPNVSPLWFMQQLPVGSVPPMVNGAPWPNNAWQKNPPPVLSNALKNESTKCVFPMQNPMNRLEECKKVPPVAGPVNVIDNSTIEDSKRKVLPAWLREGLEKMEKTKQKQQQQQQRQISNAGGDLHGTSKGIGYEVPLIAKSRMNNVVLKGEGSQATTKYAENKCIGTVEQHIGSPTEKSRRGTLTINGHNDNEEDGPQDNEALVAEQTTAVAKDGKNIEQNPIDLMQAVRRTLTELLLDVTNNIINEVAKDTLKQMRLKETSAQVVHNKDTLSSITSKLGLAAYADSSSEDMDDDVDVERRRKSAKCIDVKSGIGTANRRRERSYNNDESDSELMRVIREKKMEFAAFVKEVGVEWMQSEENNREQAQITKRESSGDDGGGSKRIESPPKHRDTPKATVNHHHHHHHHHHLTCNESRTIEGSLKNMGETSETKNQHKNDKHRTENKRRKERTTRFSDNNDRETLLPPVITDYNHSSLEQAATEGSYPRSATTPVADKGKSISRSSSKKNFSSSLSNASDVETSMSVSSSTTRHESRRSSSSSKRRSRHSSSRRHSRHKDHKPRKASKERHRRSRSHKKSRRHLDNSSDSYDERRSQSSRTSSSKRSFSRSRSRSSHLKRKAHY